MKSPARENNCIIFFPLLNPQKTKSGHILLDIDQMVQEAAPDGEKGRERKKTPLWLRSCLGYGLKFLGDFLEGRCHLVKVGPFL